MDISHAGDRNHTCAGSFAKRLHSDNDDIAIVKFSGVLPAISCSRARRALEEYFSSMLHASIDQRPHESKSHEGLHTKGPKKCYGMT